MQRSKETLFKLRKTWYMISIQTLKIRLLKLIQKLKTTILKWRHRNHIIEFKLKSICKKWRILSTNTKKVVMKLLSKLFKTQKMSFIIILKRRNIELRIKRNWNRLIKRVNFLILHLWPKKTKNFKVDLMTYKKN